MKIYKKWLFLSLIFLVSAFSLSGCGGGLNPPKSMIPPTYVKPTVKNGGIKSKPVAGSLWSGSQHGINLYSDNVAYKLNDIVTVIINNKTNVQNSSGTILSKNSSGEGNVAFGSLATSKPTGYKGANVESFNGGGKVTESGQISTVIETQVDKVFPNGNLEIKGERKIFVNGETRYILIEGVIRSADISSDNTILSSQIANPKIWINGKGPVEWQQGQGWLYRLMNFIWPF